MYTRREALRIAGTASAGSMVALSGCLGGDDGADERELRISATTAQGTPIANFVDYFADRVEENTDEGVTFERFYLDELGGTAEQVEGVSGGSIDVCCTAPSIIGAIGGVPQLGVLATPFLYDEPEQAYQAYDPEESPVVERLNPELADQGNMRLLGPSYLGKRHISINERICNPDEMQGKDIRVAEAGLFLAMVEGMGANPVTITWAEVPQALATGQVDGVDNTPASLVSASFWEHVDYMVKTKHMVHVMSGFMNNNLWENLTDERQDIFIESAAGAGDQVLEEELDRESELEDTIADNGMTIVDESDCPDRDAFRESVITSVLNEFPDWEEDINTIQDMIS